MDEARRLSASRPFGAVMVETQTAGRGRLPGRTWDTQPGLALLATIWFPRTALRSPVPHGTGQPEPSKPESSQPDMEPPVSLMAGLAVTKASLAWANSVASPFRNGLAIKWPNDLLCGDRKLAGILTEASNGMIYVGMGINCSQDSFTGKYRTEPTSILMETGRVPDRYLLLTMIIGELEILISRRVRWLDEMDYLLAWKGKTVNFRRGMADGEPLRAVLAGIAEDGGLILKSGDVIECFHSGELGPVIDECS
ncbi:MAG: biotin--[acetyl-CoA-carboxylase] ligase [Spirochaetota bacterium]